MSEIHMYGYDYSTGSYLKSLLFSFAGVGAVGHCFQLKWQYIAVLLLGFLLLMPIIILSVYRNMYEQKKFVDVGNYVEQLLFSFKRRSKILTALEDTLVLFPDGNLHDCIEGAIQYIRAAPESTDIYRNALGIIEREYGCKTVETAHRFLCNVEHNGGCYEAAANLLINDRNRWITRVYDTQKEKQLIKRNMTLAILFSFIIIGSTVLLIPNDFITVKDNPVSQVVTLIVMLVNLCIWTFVQYQLTGSWIQNKNKQKDEQLKKYYHRLMQGQLENKKKKWIVLPILFVSALTGYLLTKNVFLPASILLLGYLCMTQDKRGYRQAKKRITREVEKVFPEWMMSLSLLLQGDNVHVAVSKTVADAPVILKEELLKLMYFMEKDPNSIKPYLNFFGTLDVPDVQSSMKMLYSMAEYGSGDMGGQIEELVERNSQMLDKAEKMKMEDYLSGMGFLILSPMVTGSAKMLVDMVLLVTNLLALTNGIM